MSSPRRLQPGDRVRYAHPDPGEADLAFVVIEVTATRVVLELHHFTSPETVLLVDARST